MSKTKQKEPDWDKAKQVYVTTTIGLRTLAKEFNTTFSKVNTRYKNDNWKQARKDFAYSKKSFIVEDSIERTIKTARSKDDEHREIAHSAVMIARAGLSIIAQQIKIAQSKPELFDPLAVQRTINALKEAVNLERVTHNLPTGVLKSDVTSGGEPIQGSLNSLLDSKEVLELAKELGIDVKYFKGLAVRVANDAGSEGQSQD